MYKYSILFIILAHILPKEISAEQSKLDSLHQQLDKAEVPLEKAALLSEISDYYFMRNNDTAVHFIRTLIEFASENKLYDYETEAYNLLGRYEKKKGNIEVALRHLRKAVKIGRAHGSPLSDIYLSMALTHKVGSQIDSAFYYFNVAEHELGVDNREYLKWSCYLGYGDLHYQRKEYGSANENYRKALELVEEDPRRSSKGYTIFKVISYAFDTENFDLLLESNEMWNQFMSKGEDSDFERMPEHVAVYNMMDKSRVEIIRNLKSAIEYFREKGNVRHEAIFLTDLGEQFIRFNELEKAIAVFSNAAEIYKKHKMKWELLYVRETIAGLYGEQERYKDAFMAQLLYNELKDSLREQSIEDNFQKYKVRYETDKKEREIQIKNLELRQKNQEKNIWLGSALFIGLLALVGFSNIRTRMHKNKLKSENERVANEKKILKLEQEQKVLALESMIKGQEKERLRIAKDLHDDIGVLLTSIKVHFTTLLEGSKLSEKGSAIAPRTGDLIDRACSEVRRISHNMMPSNLMISGLTNSIKDLALNLRNNNIECTLDIIGEIDNMEMSKAISVYRILQESCNNIMKHSKATEVLIQVMVHDKYVNLTIEDNGKGFDINNEVMEDGIGIQNIRSRVEFLKGNLNIDSVEGEGTSINMQFPFSEK